MWVRRRGDDQPENETDQVDDIEQPAHEHPAEVRAVATRVDDAQVHHELAEARARDALEHDEVEETSE